MRIPLKQYWTLLATYLRPLRGQVALLGLLILADIALQLVSPQITRRFIDGALGGAALQTLTLLGLLYLGIAIVQQAMALGNTYLSESIGWRTTNRLRDDLARHTVYLDMGFQNRHTPGEMIERIDGDVTTLATFFSQMLLTVVANVLLLTGVLWLLGREDWRIALVMGLFAVLALGVGLRLRNTAVALWKETRAARADYYGYVEERLGGTEEIRANGATAFVMRGFLARQRTFGLLRVRATILSYSLTNVSWLLFASGASLALIVAALLFQQGTVTIGTVFLITQYTAMLLRPIEQLIVQLEDLQQAGASIVRIQELLSERSALPLPASPDMPLAAVPTETASVAFDRVWFAYNAAAPEAEFALRDVDFALAPGRVLGLLGRTGSGKTTLSRLLFRLYDPQQGRVIVNGRDLRRLPLPAARRQVGLVTQDVQLFRASIRDNLTFFRNTVSDSELKQLLDDLGLGSWLAAQPDGLDTRLAAGGSNLSAGQAQLLALARVFLRDPAVVVLDEASSRLDPATELLLERAIDRLLAGRTAIIIAHRLNTVLRADDIMIMENGRVAEFGPRQKLAATPASRFAQLLQAGMDEVLV